MRSFSLRNEERNAESITLGLLQKNPRAVLLHTKPDCLFTFAPDENLFDRPVSCFLRLVGLGG